MADALPWFRMYHEFASDPVVQSLAFEDQRHYVVLLCLKCNGALDRKIAAPAKLRIISKALGLDSATTDEVKRRLMEVGLISEKWQPKGWEKRQYQSDLSTKRVRKHRKTQGTGNVSETFSKRSRNGPDTDTDTDIPPLPPTVCQSAWAEFAQHRKDIRKPLTQLAATKTANLLAQYPPEVQQQMVDDSIRNGWRGVFPPKGGTHATNQPSRRESAVERVRRKNREREQAESGFTIDGGALVSHD